MDFNRREFLIGANAVAIAAATRQAHAALTPQQTASDEAFWEQIRSAYVQDPKLLNFNNGGCAPAPKPVMDAQIEAINYSNLLPVERMWAELEPKIEDVRKRLAGMWKADPECIAITRNASESLQIAQFGLDLKPGDEILLTSQDYPRMITTWEQRARREGIVLKKLDYDVPVTDAAKLVKLYEEAINWKTKVIHVSQVIFMTGQIFPIKEICQLARAHNITSIVDGAHGFAHVPFNFQEVDCDFYGASLHKWLSAPIGTGMLYVRKDRIERHWALMASPPSMDKNIRKFEEIGTHPAAMHNAILQALQFHEAIGDQRKWERFRYLKRRWAERLTRNPRARLAVSLAPEHSGAFGTIGFEGIEANKLSDELFKKHQIRVTPIKGPGIDGIRVSPNVYTSIAEVDRFSEAVEASIKALS